MEKIKTLKYVVLVCLGMTLWVPPCYSFGFPTFDIAEVGATIKGIVADVQSYASTVQSTISESKLLQSLGDATSAFTKFKDEAAELERVKEKAERVKKSMERLEKLRKRLEEEMANDEEDDGDEGVTLPTSEEDAGTAPEEDWSDGNWDTGEEGNDVADNSGSAGQETPPPATEQTPENDDDLWGDGDDGTAPSTAPTPSTTPAPSTPPVVQEEIDLWGDDEETLVVPTEQTLPNPKVIPGVLNTPGRANPTITFPNANNPAVTLPTPDMAMPEPTKPTVANPPKTAPTVTAPVSNVKIPQTKQRTPFQKLSTSVNYDVFSDKSSFASMTVKTGTNEDGRFLFSDIIAVKCGMDYKDAQNAENVKKCFKVWVECLHQDNAEDSQACLKEYKQAMQDQVAAALAASLGDKEYSASFDADVADDLSNKSEALSSERDEVAYGGEVGRASQEVLNRLLYSMSSKVLQDSFLAIEHIKKEYYNEDAD